MFSKRDNSLSTSFSSFLDIARWVAAAVVFVGHLRNPIFIGFGDLPMQERTLFVKIWYFLDGFGSTSVVVFFVLSGFLVGGIGTAKLQRGDFNICRYSIDRFARLYVVYVPALLAVAFLDFFGNKWFAGSGLWNGQSVLLSNNFSLPFDANLTMKIFATNFFMLQGFFGPYFGSDKALWSLSYEFWFYVSFGFFAVAVSSSYIKRVAASLALFGVCLTLGGRFVGLFALWIIGAAAFQYRGAAFRQPVISALTFIISSTAMRFSPLESASTAREWFLIYANGISFAWIIISLRNVDLNILLKSKKINKLLADFSYTLYLLHFPAMLFFLGAISNIFNIKELRTGFVPSSSTGLLLYISTVILVVCFAYVFAQFTERKTAKVRTWFYRKFSCATPDDASETSRAEIVKSAQGCTVLDTA